MKITTVRFYNGSLEKVTRLGVSGILFELLCVLTETQIMLKEKKDANSGKAVRVAIDDALDDRGGWTKTATGDLDWTKERESNHATKVRVGVEVQVSARSDLVIRDLMHMRQNMTQGSVDVVVLVVPSDHMSRFLPDRAPTLSETRKYIESEFKEIQHFPLILISIEHDGVGPALAKQKRRA